MFMLYSAVIIASHCESSLGSRDEYMYSSREPQHDAVMYYYYY